MSSTSTSASAAYRQGWWTWLLLALTLAVATAIIARARFSADLSAFLPQSPNAEQSLLVDQLQRGVAARTLMLAIEGGDAAARVQTSRQLAATLRAEHAEVFASVNNGERTGYIAAGELIMAQRYVLSDAVHAQRFGDVEALHAALLDTALRLASPEGAAFKALWPQDPTGEVLRVAESLLPSQAPRLDQGVWVSRDGKRALLLLTLKASHESMDHQTHALAVVEQAFARTHRSLPREAQALRLIQSGHGVFAIQSRELIEREAKRLSIAGAVAVALILGLSFGTLSAVAYAALPVMVGVLVGVAAVALVFGTVHGMTLGFGATLVGEAVDYAIYYLIQARPKAGEAGPAGAARWWREGWPTVRLGLFTSLCGFAALVFSGFPGLAQLGVFSMAGLVAAALATRYVLPRLAPAGAKGQGLRLQLGQLTQRLLRVVARWHWPMVLLGVVAAVWLALAPQALWRGSLQSLSPVPKAALALDMQLRDDLGASDARTMVVAQGATLDAALAAAEQAGAALTPLVEQGVLAGFDSPARLLPSQATQAARRAALPDAATLQKTLDEAAKGLPFKVSAIAPWAAELEAARARPLLTADALQGSPLAAALDAMSFQRRDGSWVALLPLQWATNAGDTSAPQALQAALKNVPDVRVLDIKQSLDALYAHYMDEALWQSLLGAVAVLALLALVLRDMRRWLRVVLPLTLAVLMTVALLSWAGVALGILHLIGLLLVVAVGSNYALFFDQAQADGEAYASLLLANLTTVVTFALMAVSDIQVLSAIGLVVAPGAWLALIASAALAPMGESRAVQNP